MIHLYLAGEGRSGSLAKAGLAFELIPGVSSAIAGPAYAGIPVTHRAHNSVLTIFTGHEDPEKVETTLDYPAIAKAQGTKVILMGVEQLGLIAEQLISNGLAAGTPIALIRWATTGRQQTLVGTLGNIFAKAEADGFKAPAVAVIGDVVNLRSSLQWFENRPLFGKRIVVTRSSKQAGGLLQDLRDLGADAYPLPTIRIEPPKRKREFYDLVADAHTYDWLIFTSPNGVEAFFSAFYEIYRDARSIGGVRIAAIGPATAA